MDASPSKEEGWRKEAEEGKVPGYVAVAALNQMPSETFLPYRPCGM